MSKITPKKTKLTAKQKIFVTEYLKTKNGTKAALAITPELPVASAKVKGSRMLSNDNVQTAIDNALDALGATPEFAIGVIKQVAEQTDEIGARRLAAKDILELHGWRKNDKPVVQIEVSEFFRDARHTGAIEGETVED